MTAPRRMRSITLGIALTSKGFGWTAFEGPFAPYDWGVVEVKGNKNSACLDRLARLLEQIQPEAVVLEALQQGAVVHSARIARLWRGMTSLVADSGIEVAVYKRSDIQARFRDAGATTRQEIAEAVARHVPALRASIPKKRRAWETEHHRMPLFSAAALVITHYAFGASQLFEDLKDAA